MGIGEAQVREAAVIAAATPRFADKSSDSIHAAKRIWSDFSASAHTPVKYYSSPTTFSSPTRHIHP